MWDYVARFLSIPLDVSFEKNSFFQIKSWGGGTIRGIRMKIKKIGREGHLFFYPFKALFSII